MLAREEERRRIRRDLHDGLGPALTGVAMQADAARNLLHSDPAAAAELLAELRSELTGAISEIRQLVYGLRPPALDELGLVEAVRQQAQRLSDARHDGKGMTVEVETPAGVRDLPAAVEVAAYRIASEAVTLPGTRVPLDARSGSARARRWRWRSSMTASAGRRTPASASASPLSASGPRRSAADS